MQANHTQQIWSLSPHVKVLLQLNDIIKLYLWNGEWTKWALGTRPIKMRQYIHVTYSAEHDTLQVWNSK